MKLKLPINKKYIVGVSYGPDSMALLSMMIQKNYCFAVSFVNYHLRDESNFEQKKLIEFLKINKIKYYIKEVNYDNGNKNIEAWARDIRYSFFKEICKKESTNNIVIAHNEDDLIETYLIQKKRNSIVSRYGLQYTYEENGYNFYRPLLGYSKKELLEYCGENNIPYNIDKSNFDTKYLRNKLRINYVSKLSKEERDLIKKEITKENNKLKRTLLKIKPLIENTVILQKEILNLKVDDFNLLIAQKLKRVEISYGFSKKFALDIYEKIKNDINFEFKNEYFSICYSYKKFLIYQSYPLEYNYLISNLKDNDVFKINKESKYFSLISEKGAYIKSVSKDDYFCLNGINKKVSRMFIDQHAPKYLRSIWPGIYDISNKLIYTPHYQEGFEGKKESVLDFDLEELIKCFLLYKIK